MDDKKFFIKTISYSLLLLIVIALAVIIIDPFVHYHAPFFNLAVTETDERGQQIGVAKNCEYDTAIIGSSMSENFVASWFNDGYFGDNTVKLCMQGAHFDDFSRLLKVALAKDTTKTIVMSLDNFLILNWPKDYPTTIPEYLENDDLTDDAYYVLNKSVVLYYLPIFLLNNFKNDFSSDSAYVWADRYMFNKYVALGTYAPLRLLQKMDDESDSTYFGLVDQYMESLEPYLEARPDVTFYIYSPPYSILYWDDCYLRGRFTSEISGLNETFRRLLEHPNVKLFYFQDNWDIITNLDNYKDYSHYTQDINYYIYECMRNGENQMVPDTYFDRLLKFYEELPNYDFESAFH